MKRIALFGGTFNPIHLGHLIGAQIACDSLKLDKVIFIPCFLPPHKTERDLASSTNRLKMVKLAITSNKKFVFSDFEIRQRQKSFSIDTARYFRKKFSAQTKIFLIIGEDNYTTLNAWKKIDELKKLVTFVVLNRLSQRGVPFKGSNHFKFIKMPMIEISSSLIRQNINERKPIQYMVPDKVQTYIEKNKLYR